MTDTAKRLKLLVTRPLEDQEQTLTALAELGLVGLSSPVMEARRLAFSLPKEDWQAVVVTSRNGLRMLDDEQLQQVRHHPLFCVGGKTSALANELGFDDIRFVSSDVKELAQVCERALVPDAGPLLYLTARHRTGRLGDALDNIGVCYSLLELYEMVAIERLDDAALAAIKDGSLGGVLLFSRRTAELFVALIDRYHLHSHAQKLTFFCLSSAVASPILQRGYPLVVASAPNEHSLLACAKKGDNYLI